MALFVPWFPVIGAGYTLEFDQATTTNKITIYSDAAFATPVSNPVTSAALPDGSYGFAAVFIKPGTSTVGHTRWRPVAAMGTTSSTSRTTGALGRSPQADGRRSLGPS